jgi:PAS domain S-box-containing protein
MNAHNGGTGHPVFNLNATGAPLPLPAGPPGTPGREAHEREAALKRGGSHIAPPSEPLCAPNVPGLRAELLFTLLAENVRDYAIFLLDLNGIIRCWGEGARLMKWWTRQQAEGSHLRVLYPDGGSEDGTAESHLSAAAGTGEYNGEGHRVRSDGSTFWAYVTLTALHNAEGSLVGFAKVTRDFSARRAVESALIRERDLATNDASQPAEEVHRLKRMVADLSHEVRTPLNAILGSVALLSAQADQHDPHRRHIERLRRNGQHLLDIVEGVLQMSRAESRQLPLSSGVRRLGAVIEEALADVETQAKARRLTIMNAVSGAAADLPYWGDEGRVRQILVNLLSNAVKFTDPGGRITISGGVGETVAGASLAGDGPWVYVRVEDTGRGIPPNRLESIFEPFRQSEPADQHQGTGLGLAISRELARTMGGDLVAESEIGSGSRFTLWLPMASAAPVPR